MKELIPSDHLSAVTRAVSALAKIKSDPNVPARIDVLVRLTHARLDEYKLEMGLRESLDQSLGLTSSETQAMAYIQSVIDKTTQLQDKCLSSKMWEKLQQEIEALTTVLSLAKESL